MHINLKNHLGGQGIPEGGKVTNESNCIMYVWSNLTEGGGTEWCWFK